MTEDKEMRTVGFIANESPLLSIHNIPICIAESNISQLHRDGRVLDKFLLNEMKMAAFKHTWFGCSENINLHVRVFKRLFHATVELHLTAPRFLRELNSGLPEQKLSQFFSQPN